MMIQKVLCSGVPLNANRKAIPMTIPGMVLAILLMASILFLHSTGSVLRVVTRAEPYATSVPAAAVPSATIKELR